MTSPPAQSTPMGTSEPVKSTPAIGASYSTSTTSPIQPFSAASVPAGILSYSSDYGSSLPSIVTYVESEAPSVITFGTSVVTANSASQFVIGSPKYTVGSISTSSGIRYIF